MHLTSRIFNLPRLAGALAAESTTGDVTGPAIEKV